MTNELVQLCQAFVDYQYAEYLVEDTSMDDPVWAEYRNEATWLYLDVLGRGFELTEELSEESGMYVDTAQHIVKALERIVGEV